jgi:hypothetical protein
LKESSTTTTGYGTEKTGDTQWIGHVLKRLHLIDEAHRKRQMDGVAYAVHPLEVIICMSAASLNGLYGTRNGD